MSSFLTRRATSRPHRDAADCPRLDLSLALGLLAAVAVTPPSKAESGAGPPAVAVSSSGAPIASPPAPAAPPQFTVIARTIAQDRTAQDRSASGADQAPKWFWQTWVVDYQLRLDGPAGVVLTPADVSATVEGWVSNSRVPSHATPRWSTLTVSGASGLSAGTSVVESADESHRCREHATLQVWSEAGGCPRSCARPAQHESRAEAGPAARPQVGSGTNSVAEEPEPRPLLSLAPGEVVRVRLRLVHQHFLYGMYNPLLGRRGLVLRLGSAALRDTLPLDREHHVTQANSPWADPPPEHRDTRHFISAPDSLYLAAHIPGNQSYHFPDRPVRYATKMRLRFWYLIAPGTEGECRAKLAQYKDTPTQFKGLGDGEIQQCLTVVGRWTLVERVFCTEPDATTLTLDFRITCQGADVGEMWIDDVSLEPIAGGPEGP